MYNDTKLVILYALIWRFSFSANDVCLFVLFRTILFKKFKILIYLINVTCCLLLEEIARIFGQNTLTYMLNIVEKGKLDYILRLPEKVMLKIISHLDLEDLSRLSQVNTSLRQV